ncbi:MAG: cob(I)yrinic acid a,c-diamide adenosyltransferase [Deltaproteobacteria bacterium]|nr:cob(I)yrinic acid a,c-diamide adenosyltransferase [Deltaproteobacteria bacterium]
MRIYTKTGDTGETGLFGGGRVKKSDGRVDAYGEVDELNAHLGLARSLGLDPELDALAARLQEQLFVLGGIIATPLGSKAAASLPKLQPEWVTEMERAIDRFDDELKPLTNFILPGGSASASALHVARTVCRRAERRVVPLQEADKVDIACVVYLNRLSDLLFTMARAQNHRAGVADDLWVPQK